MRLLTSFVAGLLTAVFPGVIALGEEYSLTASSRAGDSARVELLLEVAGDLKVVDDSQVKTVPLKVVGSAAYEELLLGKPETLAGNAHGARNYEKLEAELQIDEQRHATRLREGRVAIGVEVRDGESTYWSPAGPLSREELDLIDVHGSSLLVDGLLPDKPVGVESTWQPPDAVLLGILGLDAISASTVTGALEEVTPELARFEMSGNVQGAIGGVSTDIELKAKCKFDRNAGRITWFALLIKENRSVGHVGPGIDAVARLQMKIVPTAKPDADLLTTAQTVRDSASEESLALGYRSPDGGFQFLHDRQWHVVNDEPKLVVLRRVNRGELVAQANVTPLAPATTDKPTTLAEFQEDVRKARREQLRTIRQGVGTIQPPGGPLVPRRGDWPGCRNPHRVALLFGDRRQGASGVARVHTRAVAVRETRRRRPTAGRDG